MVEVLKVSSRSNPNAVAGALAGDSIGIGPARNLQNLDHLPPNFKASRAPDPRPPLSPPKVTGLSLRQANRQLLPGPDPRRDASRRRRVHEPLFPRPASDGRTASGR